MVRRGSRVSQTNMRTKSRGVGSQQCVVTSRKTFDIGNSDASGVISGAISLDPLTYYVTSAVRGIAGSYEFYRIRSAKLTVIGVAGSTAVGSTTTAFVCSPELQLAAFSGSASTRSSIVYSEQSNMTHPHNATTIHTMSNRTMGRRWFSTNYGIATNVDDFDRTIGAMLVYYGTQTVSSAALIRFQLEVSYELRGLAAASAFTLMRGVEKSGTDEPLVVPIFADISEWPGEVILKRREGEQKYILPAQ